MTDLRGKEMTAGAYCVLAPLSSHNMPGFLSPIAEVEEDVHCGSRRCGAPITE